LRKGLGDRRRRDDDRRRRDDDRRRRDDDRRRRDDNVCTARLIINSRK
jgi:hypothetical protein